jgi:hypothetical protein
MFFTVRTFSKLFIILLPFSALAETYQWAAPTRFVSALCTKFDFVSDLPLSHETTELFSNWSQYENFRKQEMNDQWENGSSEEFQSWLDKIGSQGKVESVLIFYLSTHQNKDGSLKFSKGADLSGKDLIQSLKKVSQRFQKVLFIDDSCYAASLEECGTWPENIIRLYSSDKKEAAIDVEFNKGPYGLDDFSKKEREFLAEKYTWKPKGMSFFGLMTLKAGLDLKDLSSSLDLQTFFKALNRFRDQYDEDVRQAKVQHFILKPESANLTLLKRIK